MPLELLIVAGTSDSKSKRFGCGDAIEELLDGNANVSVRGNAYGCQMRQVVVRMWMRRARISRSRALDEKLVQGKVAFRRSKEDFAQSMQRDETGVAKMST